MIWKDIKVDIGRGDVIGFYTRQVDREGQEDRRIFLKALYTLQQEGKLPKGYRLVPDISYEEIDFSGFEEAFRLLPEREQIPLGWGATYVNEW